VLNGICDPWETPSHCPSDCPEAPTTTTTRPGLLEAVCGNAKCEQGEDFLNCPDDCIEVTPGTTTTTSLSKPYFNVITGMFAAVERSWLYILAALLFLIAVILAVIRYILLPRIIPPKEK
jgi:hypothetical protein